MHCSLLLEETRIYSCQSLYPVRYLSSLSWLSFADVYVCDLPTSANWTIVMLRLWIGLEVEWLQRAPATQRLRIIEYDNLLLQVVVKLIRRVPT